MSLPSGLLHQPKTSRMVSQILPRSHPAQAPPLAAVDELPLPNLISHGILLTHVTHIQTRTFR